MDTRQAARVARAETRSKVSNSMVMESPVVPLELWTTFKKDGESCAGKSFYSWEKKEKKSVDVDHLDEFSWIFKFWTPKPSGSDNRRLCCPNE